MTATEEERKRLTRDLHDHCGQVMTAMQFGMQTLKKSLPDKNDSVVEQIDRLVEMTAQLAAEIRKMTSRLRPPVLDEIGLVAGLRWLLDEFNRNYPEIGLKSKLLRESDFTGRIAPTVEDAVYRICQEALTNVARHSDAKNVTVQFLLEKGRLWLRVEDDGCGFDLQRCWSSVKGFCGIGLIGMRERTSSHGGSFQVTTEEGKGTTILCSFPIAEEVHP